MKRAVCIFTAVIMSIALLSACTRAEESAELSPWEPQIENLQWGMSKEEIQELYQCAEEENANGLLYLILDKPVELCGVSVKATLTLDDSFGLIRVSCTAEEDGYKKLEQKLVEELSDYRTGAQISEGASWKSETVMQKYDSESLAQAYANVFGEGVIGDDYLEGIRLTPLVFYELKRTDGGCRLIIDATVKEEMEYIFTD